MAESYEVTRRYRRAVVNVTADVTVDQAGAETHVTGRFLILGGGGAWIEMTGTHLIDSVGALRFSLPRAAEEIACRAVVRNRVVRRGAGVEFLDISPGDRDHIVAFVAHQTRGKTVSVRPADPSA